MLQPAFSHGAESPLHGLEGAQHERGHEPEDHDADERGQKQEERHVAYHVVAQGLVLLLERNDHADGAADGVERPALLGKARDVDLAGRLPVTFQAALVRAQGLHVAELGSPAVGGGLGAVGVVIVLDDAVVLDSRALAEQCEGLGLEGVGLVLGATRLEVRVPDGVVVARREDGPHALPHDGAVQALELEHAVAGVVDGVLGIVHELPDGVHLAGEGAGLLGQRVFHVLRLGADVEEGEGCRCRNEHRRQHQHAYHA